MMAKGMPSDAYNLFRQAILEERQVMCAYGGHRRELCPHIIGHTKGEEKVLAFQFGGTSSSTLPPRGQWRCLVLANVTEISLRDGPWRSGSNHSQQQRCVEDIDLDVNVHVRRPAARSRGSGSASGMARKSPGRKAARMPRR
jgi:hypothetical protein